MFKVDRGFSVGCSGCPPVLVHRYSSVPGCDHRLDGQYHTGTQFFPWCPCVKIGYFGRFVEFFPATVAHEFPDYVAAAGGYHFFYGFTDVTHSVARFCSLYASFKAFLARLHEVLGFLRGIVAWYDSCSCVSHHSVESNPDVYAQHRTACESVSHAPDAVDNDIVHRYAYMSGETPIVMKCALAACFLAQFFTELVDFIGCHAGCSALSDGIPYPRCTLSDIPYIF